MRSLRFFMLMAVVICSLAVNAQDAIANGDNSTATSTVLEHYGTDIKCENLTLLQHNDTLVSDVELLKSIGDDTSAKRLKKAKMLKWTAWVGGSVLFLAGAYCLCGTAFVAQNNNGTEVNWFAVGAAASFGASAIWTTSFLLAAHHQKKLALSANVSMLNDNMANRKTLGVGLSFKF